MFERIRIMRVLRFFNNKYFPLWLQVRLKAWSEQAVEDIRKTKVIFFAKDANLQMLSKAAQYVQQPANLTLILCSKTPPFAAGT